MPDLKKLAEVLNKHGWRAEIRPTGALMVLRPVEINLYWNGKEDPAFYNALLDLLESKGLSPVLQTASQGQGDYACLVYGDSYRTGQGSTRTEAIVNAVIACDDAGLLEGGA